MADQIQIKDLLLRTIIGINEEERRARQDVLIIQLVEESRFYLVEKLAAEIAKTCLEDPHVERVSVRVEKPGALRFARSVGVEIQRTRAEAEA